MSRGVFVGNIPYEATEEDLRGFFSQVGPVSSFRLVLDHDSKKPRGFGFCDFLDAQTAQSAIRNLNGKEFMGRALRVGRADNEGKPYAAAAAASASSSSSASASQFGAPPQLQQLQQPQQTVQQVVESQSPAQLADVLARMRALVQQSPEHARSVLMANPQFAYALLQAEVVMGFVDANAAQAMLRGGSLPPPPAAAAAAAMQQPTAATFGDASAAAVPPPPPPIATTAPIAPVPVAAAAQPLPPPPPPPPPMSAPAAPAAAQDVDGQQQVIQAVMALTPEQIDALGPAERQQVLDIRNFFLAQQQR